MVPGGAAPTNTNTHLHSEVVIEETQTSRGGAGKALPLKNVAHALAAAERRYEERKQRFSKFLQVKADIQLDQALYEPSETVTGKIYIKCVQLAGGTRQKLIRPLMEAKHLEIEVSGKEKVSWVEPLLVPRERSTSPATKYNTTS